MDFGQSDSSPRPLKTNTISGPNAIPGPSNRDIHFDSSIIKSRSTEKEGYFFNIFLIRFNSDDLTHYTNPVYIPKISPFPNTLGAIQTTGWGIFSPNIPSIFNWSTTTQLLTFSNLLGILSCSILLFVAGLYLLHILAIAFA